MYSNNGITWNCDGYLFKGYEKGTVSVNQSGYGLIFASNRFLTALYKGTKNATYFNGIAIFTSIDGVNWSVSNFSLYDPNDPTKWVISAARGNFIAVNKSNGDVYNSTDGTTWYYSSTIPFVRNWGRFFELGNKYVNIPDYCSKTPAVSRIGVYSAGLDGGWTTFNLPLNTPVSPITANSTYCQFFGYDI